MLCLPRIAVAGLVNSASLFSLSKPEARIAGKVRGVERLLKTATSLHPNAALYRKLGFTALVLGRTEDAATILSHGAMLYPHDKMLVLQLGDMLEILGKHEAALYQWRLAGVTPTYLVNRGLTYYMPGQQLDPESRRNLIARFWNDSSSTWAVIGQHYWDEGLIEQAVTAYTTAVEIDRDWSSTDERYLANLYLAMLLQRMGDWGRAYHAFGATLKMAETSPRYNSLFGVGHIHLNMGILSQQQRHSEQALTHLSQAMKLGQDDADTYYWLSLAERDEGQYQRALAYITIAISKKGDVAEYYQLQASLYLAMNDVTAAVGAFQQALQIRPDDPSIQRSLFDLQSR